MKITYNKQMSWGQVGGHMYNNIGVFRVDTTKFPLLNAANVAYAQSLCRQLEKNLFETKA